MVRSAASERDGENIYYISTSYGRVYFDWDPEDQDIDDSPAKGGEADNVALLLDSSEHALKALIRTPKFRTFYVGLTRARKSLHIIESQSHHGSAMKTREDFLNKAERANQRSEGQGYGPAKFNHERIATIWSVVLGRCVTPEQVVACMIGLKLARLAEDMSKDDSWVDIIGYALGGEIINDCDDS